ncbi:MAG: aromatic aminobenezylarsenical efflux permease ArsG family transporter, partial [Bacteroidales bacterium]
MEALLNELYANASGPLISALLLGLLTAMAPCPLTLNITAIGYISKDLSHRNRIFYNGLFYTLGTLFSYTGLALILFFGADQFKISSIFQQYSEKIIGPLLLIIGIFMLGLLQLRFPAFSRFTNRFQHRKRFSFRDAFLLGAVLALAFCPYSGILYFGILIPLTITSEAIHLPLVFSIAAGLPVVIFAWLLAFAIAGVGKLYNRLKAFEYWFRKVVAVVFIGIGIFYLI